MKRGVSRRGFLKRAAVGAAGPLILPGLSLAETPSGRLQHAAIGVTGQGAAVLRAVNHTEKVDVVALCDVDRPRLRAAAKSFPEARLYTDWRELYAEESDRIDSVAVATPDHMHAPITMAALQLGKHVFCEKPLCHEVAEVRAIAEKAREIGVATQMGIQLHGAIYYRQAVRMLQSGVIGKIKEWHSWISARYTPPGGKRPAGEDPLPRGLDWDLWLGVAPDRPYKEDIYHPKKWRFFRDFGTGAQGDFACHIFDPLFTALDLSPPLSVTAEVADHDPDVWPAWEIVRYEFPGTNLTAGITVSATWYDGGKKPSLEGTPLPADYVLPGSGSLILGEDGVMLLPHNDDAILLFPEEAFTNYEKPEVEHVNHYGEWVDACLGSGAPGANFDYAGPLTEAALLGTVATRFPGKRLEWDTQELKFSNAPKANSALWRRYRSGWRMRRLG
jgi:predicted dehydrogenase